MLAGTTLSARTNDSSGSSVTVLGNYGYNNTWRNYGGLDIRGFVPFGKHFELKADAEVLTAGIFSGSVTFTPKFPLSVGELFLDGTLNYRNLFKYKSAEFVTAASFGYRMDFVSVQAGLFYRGIFNTDRNAEGPYVGEKPVDMVYRVSFNVRPSTSRWNAGGGITNYNEYEYERMWQPMFFIDGRYDLSDSLSLLATVQVKQSGMFHQIVSFYGIDTKVGLRYEF